MHHTQCLSKWVRYRIGSLASHSPVHRWHSQQSLMCGPIASCSNNLPFNRFVASGVFLVAKSLRNLNVICRHASRIRTRSRWETCWAMSLKTWWSVLWHAAMTFRKERVSFELTNERMSNSISGGKTVSDV